METKVEKVMHMTTGTGEDSYVNCCLTQTMVINKVTPTIKEALKELYSSMSLEQVIMADLGCAFGPNALMLIPEIIDETERIHRKLNRQMPELHIFLNDLPANDYNSIFMSLPSFYEKLKREKGFISDICFVSGSPGSFHRRIFPKKFLHFVHASSSVHWLSEVPKGLVSEDGTQLNKGNMYISVTSPPGVLKAYQDQFSVDFTSLLKSRAEEVVPGGWMVFTIMCSTESVGPQHFWLFEVLGKPLQDMVAEGLIEGKKLDEFNVPFYPPTVEEVKNLIEAESSFHLHKIETFSVHWDLPIINGQKSNGTVDLPSRARYITNNVFLGVESMSNAYFGEAITKEYRSRVGKIVEERMAREKLEIMYQVISVMRKPICSK